MSVRVEHDEDANVYRLVGDVDGVPIAFAEVPGDTVQARVAAVHELEGASGGGGGGGARGGGAGGGGGFDPADFSDNGDGTYTRHSDGATGRFTPGGFEAS